MQLTRRECLFLPGMAALAQGLTGQSTVEDEIQKMAEQPPVVILGHKILPRLKLAARAC